MNLLLDTHIWIWSVGDRRRLTPRVVRELANSDDNELWLSPISVWEVQILYRKRRIELEGMDGETWTRRALEIRPLNEATLTIDVVLEIPKLNLTHGDPGDHFLVATAKVLGLTLVTSDERIISSADVPILANL
jgi:PIN domain nuclease of toxin-antitoxin system